MSTQVVTPVSPQVPVIRSTVLRSMSCVIAATAAHYGLTVLHDDADDLTVARHAPDLAEHNIHDAA